MQGALHRLQQDHRDIRPEVPEINAISIDGGVALSGVDLLKGVRKGLKLMATVFTSAGAAVVTNRMIQAGTAPKNIGWERERREPL